jgi:hypothetical protein
MTYLGMPEHEEKALPSIDDALAIDADDSDYLAMKSLILSNLEREKEGLTVADQAIAINPGPFQWYVRAIALAEARLWQGAHDACEKALELDPDFEGAANLQNNILRAQGKLDDSERSTMAQLARNAENPDALANAGWTKLQQHDPKKAEELFRESLRIEPQNENARDGLIESYKARSLFYRLYLRWVFLLQKMEGKNQWAVIIGFYLLYRFGRAAMSNIHPALGVAVVVLYLVLAFGTFIAPGIGHFLILKDRIARLSLNQRERRDGLAVGGSFFLGLLLVILGFTALPSALAILGGAFILATIPFSLVFRNIRTKGQLLFGGIALFDIAAGAFALSQGALIATLFDGPAGPLVTIAILATFLSTWISAVPSLVRLR